MANKSFRNLTARNQSSLVTQLHKLINYYGDIFCSRERVYLKSLTQYDNCIYWLEDDEKKIVAVAILDPNHTLNIEGISLKVLGYTISKRPGQMDRILSHIWSDYEGDSIALVCRKTLANVFDLENLNLVEITPIELQKNWPELASQSTDYFNVRRESVFEGLLRKDYYLYLKMNEKDMDVLSTNNADLYNFLQSKMTFMKQKV